METPWQCLLQTFLRSISLTFEGDPKAGAHVLLLAALFLRGKAGHVATVLSHIQVTLPGPDGGREVLENRQSSWKLGFRIRVSFPWLPQHVTTNLVA